MNRVTRMQNLDKFVSISDTSLAQINGGENADYNFGYECGKDTRRSINRFVYWWQHKVLVQESVNYNE